VKFHPGAAIDPHKLMNLVSTTEGAQFTPAGVLRLPLEASLAPDQLLEQLRAQIAGLNADI
jgi:transcription-repair coupling factor (superfamily II helicase)